MRLEYLPPYSPDFSLIEEAFAELKVWMKKNYLLADGYKSFEDFWELHWVICITNPEIIFVHVKSQYSIKRRLVIPPK